MSTAGPAITFATGPVAYSLAGVTVTWLGQSPPFKLSHWFP